MPLRGQDYQKRSEAASRILKSYRVLAGWTQAELAERLGVVQSLVSKVESRERRLDVVELLQYLDVLGRSASEFLDDLERFTSSPHTPLN